MTNLSYPQRTEVAPVHKTGAISANGSWIKMFVNLWDNPRVARLCELLQCVEALALGCLFRVWSLADSHSTDGRLEFSASALNRKTGVEGFAEALEKVGWLEIGDGFVTVVRFDEHNGQSAKRRAQDASRAARYRKSSNSQDGVTPASRSERDGNVIQIRVEKKKSNSISGRPELGEVLIPEKMQTEAVSSAAALWFKHLELVAPDKVPPSGSPQLQAFWCEAARAGPDEFVRQVERCVSRGWINLRSSHDGKSDGKSSSPKSDGASGDGEAQQAWQRIRKAANDTHGDAKAFEASIGQKLAEILKTIRLTRKKIDEANDFDRQKFQKQFIDEFQRQGATA